MDTKAKLGVIFLSIVGVAACDIGCGNETISSSTSPNGTLKAVVFNRNCGATTGFNTQVSVVPANKASPSGGGNALILDGTVPVELNWASESALTINGLGVAHVFKKESSAAGVAISYGK